jgi:hypothetical protein
VRIAPDAREISGIEFMLRICLTLLLAFTALLAQAQMYKWVDENGRTQYSDRPPPPGTKSDQVTKSSSRTPAATAPAPAAAGKGAPTGAAAQELEFRKRQMATQDKAKDDEKKAADAKSKQENCDLAQARVRTLTDGGRILKPSASGEREYMGTEEIEAEKPIAQKKADEACK